MTDYKPATQPTLYFIGVTTAKSSIMKVFPAWAAYLGLKEATIKGIDFPLHADRAAYRAAVSFIKQDPLSLGALVTTHKIDLYKACRDQFDEIDPHAKFLGETSCLSKRDGRLVCHAKDPISSGLALDGFIPRGHFATTGAELFSIGAGGSTIALTWHMMRAERGADRPSRIIVSNRSSARLDEIRRIHDELGSGVPTGYVLAPRPRDNDAIVADLKLGSLIINATGLGKDAPGSPLTGEVRFPRNAIVWDLNYRGDLIFLDQAHAQKSTRGLQIEDGWTYFIHGWTQVIAEVFHIDIPASGSRFNEISAIAAAATKA
jgi:shikimate 5-dehydrogenase